MSFDHQKATSRYSFGPQTAHRQLKSKSSPTIEGASASRLFMNELAP
jgi:hypothetical protein